MAKRIVDLTQCFGERRAEYPRLMGHLRTLHAHETQKREERTVKATPAGEDIAAKVRQVELEQEIKNLQARLECLASLIPPEDVAAAAELRGLVPPLETFRVWANEANPGDTLEEDEEKPW